ncbi:hypothetical protein BDD12DRAFT_903538 [Trichophaea hybrida]|nr:hypothetical protein BDD12DRAFT_903538 [Trichophaea hybrida]
MALSSTPSPDSQMNLLSAWDRSFDVFRSKLTPKELKQWNSMGRQPATYAELLDAAQRASIDVERKRYVFTKTVQSIVQTINQYAIVADVMVQHNPHNIALAWGAFRFIMLAAVNEGTTSRKIMDSLNHIARIIFRADTYIKLFAHHEASAKDLLGQLHDDLVALFVEVLTFLFRAVKFFNKPTARRYISAAFKPFDRKFQETYENISNFERRVGEDIQSIHTEFEILQQAVENGKWLNHAEVAICSDLKRLNEEHLDGTCEWFLNNDKVKNWKSSCSVSGLWVSGKPGCGKSTIASQLIHHFSTSVLPVLRIFCKTGIDNRNDVVSILRNILFQLIESSVAAVDNRKLHEIITAQRTTSKDSYATSIPQMWLALSRILQSTNGCICVIDALDECCNSTQEIAEFVCQLTDVFSAFPSVKVIVFSRLPIPDVDNSTRVWECLSITVDDVVGDITKFASVKLEASRKLRNPKVKDRLLKPLIDGSEGMILWTRLMLSELECNHYQVEEILKKPPAGLKALYAGILQRLFSTESEALRKQKSHALRLVLAAARPLHLKEFALAIETLKGLPDHEDYDIAEDNAQEIINGVAPLLTISPDNTVQILHASLKDFLITPGNTGLHDFFFDLGQLHRPVATALLSYLSFPSFIGDLVGSPVEIETKYPLLEYASSYLIWHITKVGADDHTHDCLEKLRTFLWSTQGWKWLERLHTRYGISVGHLQLLQSHLICWVDSLPSEAVSDRSIFENLLVDLCQKRIVGRTEHGTELDEFALEALYSLGDVYWHQGRWKEAGELAIKVMETRRRKLGHKHPDTLRSMGDLAWSLCNQGHWKEAEELAVQVTEARKEVLGAEHPHTLTSMSTIAVVLCNQGRYKESEELWIQVTEARTRVLGLEHPDTLTSMSNFIKTYVNQGRIKEAEDLAIEVAEIRERVLGQEHPYTLQSFSILASIYQDRGRWKDAEELENKVWQMKKRVLGQYHPDTLTSMNNLAVTYANQGREEAEELAVQVVDIRKRILGQEHPYTLQSLSILASIYQDHGRLKEAEAVEIEAWEMKKRVIGQGHPDTLTSMNNLARTYKLQGHIDQAISLMEQVVALRLQRLGERHPHTICSANSLSEWRHIRDGGFPETRR